MHRPSGERALGSIDTPNAVRGASTGFTVLLLGGLLMPLVATVAPPLGGVWLTATAILAFGIAGARIGNSALPARHGAVAAVGSYLLIVPLLMMHSASRDPLQMAMTLVAAIAVGALTGWLKARIGSDQREPGPVARSSAPPHRASGTRVTQARRRRGRR
ncbi:hypothetical protein SAMN06265360_12254 [Haloechinothrix alba]|uniref:Uncharacterized protein n=1 Tax=Haloechinothrix alba TaxID=664784 RepID=A0A238ZLN9_9PSEU|nr:hypothetical protein SAMN06265360_12254 [Haloechinothrix alba]